MRGGGKVLRIGTLSVLLVLASAGGWVVWKDRHPAPARFCTLGLPFVTIDGEGVAIQDGGRPGDDGCGTDETMPDMKVLGLDCQIREPDGDVVVELVPNREDGLCGQPDGNGSYPDPWPHR